MNKKNSLLTGLSILLVGFSQLNIPNASAENWQSIEKIFNRKGTAKDNMIKITFPRSDLQEEITSHRGSVSEYRNYFR
jgi:hypothetical protein